MTYPKKTASEFLAYLLDGGNSFDKTKRIDRSTMCLRTNPFFKSNPDESELTIDEMNNLFGLDGIEKVDVRCWVGFLLGTYSYKELLPNRSKIFELVISKISDDWSANEVKWVMNLE